MNMLAKKHAKYGYHWSDSHGEKNWERFPIPEFDRTNVFISPLHTYPFHLMLQSVLFCVINMSIMRTPCDNG